MDLGEGERSAPARVAVVARSPGQAVLELTIAEGKNRQVRRMCEAVGLPLQALERIAFGPLVLGSLRAGKSRVLTSIEIERLVAATRTRAETGTRTRRWGVSHSVRRR